MRRIFSDEKVDTHDLETKILHFVQYDNQSKFSLLRVQARSIRTSLEIRENTQNHWDIHPRVEKDRSPDTISLLHQISPRKCQ